MKPILCLIVLLFPFQLYPCTQIAQSAYDPSAYYATTHGLTGAPLKTALNLIIKNHTVYSYTPCVWDILKITDEDPNDPNNVIAYYTQRPILKTNRDQGGNTPDAWNREHIWPKGHGFPDKNDHAYTDVHAIRPSDKSVNADRADHDFGEGTTPHYECTQCKTANSIWEPPSTLQGDTARMVFYMATRYEGGDNSGVGDLRLVDQITSSGGNTLGVLCDLVQWHLDDPVSQQETTRNQIVYQWQGNRNPFIDHPEFVVPIWGEQCGITQTVEASEDIPLLPLWALVLLPSGLLLLGFRKGRL